ncbi:MAG: ATP-grasp fold amidoligase family protein [Sediminibacterium sp.]
MLKTGLLLINKYLGFLLTNRAYSNLLFWFNSKRLGKSFYKLNLNAPQTFNEKISWIKFNIQSPLSVIVADKFLVRNYIEQKIGSQTLIPLITVYDSPELINFKELPQQFVMKLNNGSGYNLICRDKSKIDESDELQKFKSAFQSDIYSMSREWHYKKIETKIIVEELLDGDLLDYKFFCNSNGPFLIQVDVDRFANHQRNIYDLSWQLMPFKIRYDNSSREIEPPKGLQKMIEIAKKLSGDFMFSRVDLYEHNNKIYFGEITLHPGGGLEPFDCYSSDLEMGQFISLPN